MRRDDTKAEAANVREIVTNGGLNLLLDLQQADTRAETGRHEVSEKMRSVFELCFSMLRLFRCGPAVITRDLASSRFAAGQSRFFSALVIRRPLFGPQLECPCFQ